MIATLTALAVLIQDPAAQALESNNQAVALISKVLAHYYKAKKLSGTILLTTVAGGVTGTLKTYIQFDDPSKLYIRQDLSTANSGGTWKIVSDGVRFSYPLPDSQLGSQNRKNLVEPVSSNGDVRSFRDIYSIGGGGLKDRSAPLDLAIGRFEDLKQFKGHLATHQMVGTVELRGKQCQVVEGDWSVVRGVPSESKYRLMATVEGELMRYEIIDHVINPQNSSTMIDIRQVWDVDLHLDGETREDLYLGG